MKGCISVGTSGWHYDHWKETYYPEELSTEDQLAHYSGDLDSVEINNSFYQIPSGKTLRSWRDTVPEEFRLSVKASRYITHMKKLKDPQEPLEHFYSAIEPIREKTAAVLFQLPPNFGCNLKRLENFLKALPEDTPPVAFEFRNPDWYREEVTGILQRFNAAFCIYDLAGHLSPKEVTADLVYVRLHGPSEEKYQGEYGQQGLSGWAGAVHAWREQGKTICFYFDNDTNGAAVRDAMRLNSMME